MSIMTLTIYLYIYLYREREKSKSRGFGFVMLCFGLLFQEHSYPSTQRVLWMWSCMIGFLCCQRYSSTCNGICHSWNSPPQPHLVGWYKTSLDKLVFLMSSTMMHGNLLVHILKIKGSNRRCLEFLFMCLQVIRTKLFELSHKCIVHNIACTKHREYGYTFGTRVETISCMLFVLCHSNKCIF